MESTRHQADMSSHAVPELDYEVKDWLVDSRRNLLITAAVGVFPYTRQTRTTRWRDDASGARATAYNEARADLRDTLMAIMLANRLKPFGSVPLGMSSSFWLKHAGSTDHGNLEKALEDAPKSIQYPDDRWIWHRRFGFKAKGKPRFRLHLWETDPIFDEV